jgi:thermolysin
MKRLALAGAVVLLAALSPNPRLLAQTAAPLRSLNATTAAVAALRQSDQLVDDMSRSGQLRRVATFTDPLIPGRSHERFQQYVNGVPVWATTITRQLDAAGTSVSILGSFYQLDAFDTTPVIDAAAARQVAAADAGVELGAVDTPLYVLMSAGAPRLVYSLRVATPKLQLRRYFVDARSGAIALIRDETKHEVGTGVGVFGSPKKISTSAFAGTFVAVDELRPPVLNTYNMRGNPTALELLLNGLRPLFTSDLASDADNQWTDGAAVDAHVYAGWTYDYYFKRFQRMGLDNNNLQILSFVHPVNRADFATNGPLFPDLFVNAFYAGNGVMVYGEGLPPGVTIGGQSYDYFSGALDVVAHELTHGVTDYTSQLDYQGESGALNEAFSDMMGTSVEFFFQPPGTGRGQADYLLGEDIAQPGGNRSMSNPMAFGDPDHYSNRYIGPDDNGGVHTNSGIANNAFYLAIEGGTNRTSGLSVQGVGAANREQIEKVFYRAFILLPSNATFSTARAATIQTARDLYGIGSNAERAVTQAWTAVGVL